MSQIQKIPVKPEKHTADTIQLFIKVLNEV